ncbi:hypothetical protein SpAn4DRAFT_2582 [Sporomusa ovata]|uniref:Uncharacterized protein n=1 Tax=Sporomusa ovata TaxID=2378 RepID=A0A0U1L0Z5_9FIRM|nr:hypothetical protein SpAn4DRAFT_2582 [Sporomusa ovata]
MVHLEQGQKQIEAKIDTGFKNTKEANDAILDLIEKTLP